MVRTQSLEHDSFLGHAHVIVLWPSERRSVKKQIVFRGCVDAIFDNGRSDLQVGVLIHV